MFYCNHTVCLRNNLTACNDKKQLCHTDIQITNAKILNRIEENKRKFEEKKKSYVLGSVPVFSLTQLPTKAFKNLV